MRFTFCFSRSWIPYPCTFVRLLPCWPGANRRFSTAHFSEKQRSPFRKSFIPSRRQSRQTGPRILAKCSPSSECRIPGTEPDASLPSHAAPLGRPASIVGNGCDVLDGLDLHADGLQGPDGGLAPG